ncbi:uncharacterized protein [Elaeis guineensis]|uniref:uncharacterized protein n=1 Tax=Elaeis guineensis var. tenera TaxID=51953 RepID=UPI003C6CFA9D
MYDAGIPFNAINYDSFSAVVEAIGQYGPSMKPLTYHKVRVTYLKKEVETTHNLLKSFKEWVKMGCFIMADGWKDRKEITLINFLVNSLKRTMFLKSVDASYSKTGEKIFELLDKFIQMLGPEYVVQVIIDSASNNVAAAKLLEAKYPHLYWSPCAADRIDLMLEDIFKIPLLHKIIKKEVALTKLSRYAKTRFATTFLTLARVHKQKNNLRKMFISEEWSTSKWAKEQIDKGLTKTILSPFWNNIVVPRSADEPLNNLIRDFCKVCSGCSRPRFLISRSGHDNCICSQVGKLASWVLRLVDSEKKPPIGYIYKAMDRAKEAIAKTFDHKEERYIAIFTIIEQR